MQHKVHCQAHFLDFELQKVQNECFPSLSAGGGNESFSSLPTAT